MHSGTWSWAWCSVQCSVSPCCIVINLIPAGLIERLMAWVGQTSCSSWLTVTNAAAPFPGSSSLLHCIDLVVPLLFLELMEEPVQVTILRQTHLIASESSSFHSNYTVIIIYRKKRFILVDKGIKIIFFFQPKHCLFNAHGQQRYSGSTYVVLMKCSFGIKRDQSVPGQTFHTPSHHLRQFEL